MVAIPGAGQPITYDFIRQLVDAANKSSTTTTVVKTNVPDEIRVYYHNSTKENPQATLQVQMGRVPVKGYGKVAWSPKFRNTPIIVAQPVISKNFDKKDAGVSVTVGDPTSGGFELSVHDLAGKLVSYEVVVNFIAMGYA